MPDVLMINGKAETMFDGEDFFRLLREKLGDDAETYARDLVTAAESVAFDQEKCVGECDHTYRMQEHYERIIRDTVDDLREIGVTAEQNKVLRLALNDCTRSIGADKGFVYVQVHESVKVLRKIYRQVLDRIHQTPVLPIKDPVQIDFAAFDRELKRLEELR